MEDCINSQSYTFLELVGMAGGIILFFGILIAMCGFVAWKMENYT